LSPLPFGVFPTVFISNWLKLTEVQTLVSIAIPLRGNF
jgi:hypothetical protein